MHSNTFGPSHNGRGAVIASTLLLLAILGPSTVAAARTATPTSKGADGVKIMVYEGKLQSSEGRAISGIFPLSFELHKRARGGRSLWNETHYVAVDNGVYTVELGRSSKIKGSIDLTSAYLGVKLGDSELFREKLDLRTVRDVEAVPTPARGSPVSGRPTGAAPPRTSGGRSVVDYAEEAGQAYVANQAKVAERIGTMTAKQVEDAVEKLKKFKGGAQLGTTKKYTESVGGERGNEYTLSCPKGYVVTGITGGAGLYIDSIKLICQPLE